MCFNLIETHLQSKLSILTAQCVNREAHHDRNRSMLGRLDEICTIIVVAIFQREDGNIFMRVWENGEQNRDRVVVLWVQETLRRVRKSLKMNSSGLNS